MIQFGDYTIIAIYIAAVLGIGFYFSRGEKNSVSYLLGGRNMPSLAVGIACMMSLLSSVSLVTIPGEVYNNGLTLFILSSALGVLLAVPCYLLFTRFYFRLGSFTPYEYLEYRYNASIRAVVAISAFYTRVMYLAMVLYATAKIFEAAYNWLGPLTIGLVGVVGIFYTMKGGAKAVIWTDVLQFFVLVSGFGLVVWIICSKIDGGAFEAVRFAIAQGHGTPEFSERSFYSFSPYPRLTIWPLLYVAITGPLITACSDQITVQRILSTRNWKEGLKSQIVSCISSIPFTLLLWFVGLAVFTYYAQNPDPVLKGRAGDAALFHFLSTRLPSPIPGLFIAAMLAAVMSTLSSGLNSMATVWLKEIHVKFINRNLKSDHEVRISKLATIWIGIFCISFGLLLDFSGSWFEQSVAEVGTLFYLLGAAILPAFLFAVISSRANATLIWGYTAFAFGEGIAGNLWYAMSRHAEQNYLNNPASGLGWGGPLPWLWMTIPLVIGIILTLPWVFTRLRNQKFIRATALAGCFFFGAAILTAQWCFFSHYYACGEPLARSFNYYLPISLPTALIILFFCPKQPPKKYQGLTLWTIGQPIAAKK